MAAPCPVVVIGGSAGALTPLLELVGALPAGFPAAVLVVIHVPEDQPSALADLLGTAGPLPARRASSGLWPQAGQVYAAVPGCHLMLLGGALTLSSGPRENRARPSIDVLFRSAALLGPDTAGVLLSGLFDDGVSGLWAISQAGGLTAAQHPEEAAYPDMPLNAIRRVPVSEILPARALAARLSTWAGERAAARALEASRMDEPPEPPDTDLPGSRLLSTELAYAAGHPLPARELLAQLPLSPLTCPECHGILMRIREGQSERYRCHTGHAYSALTLLSEQRRAVEDALWAGVRALNEQQLLLEHLGEHLAEQGQQIGAQALRGERDETVRRTQELLNLTLRGLEPLAEPR